MTQSWTPLSLVAWTTDYFREHGVASPRLDAELLLAHVLGCGRLDLYLDFERPVEAPERDQYRALVRARAGERVPVAYLIGEREFWSQSFRVTRDVLIPRPETELLVQVVRDLAPRRLAEVGVGSGAVIGALALELTEAELVGVDCSEPALEVAAQNMERLGVSARVRLLCGDGLAPLDGPFDALVCNPPYVPSGDLDELAPELAHEPRVALDGGPDGLDFIRRLVPLASELVPTGWLALEVGLGQAEATQALLAEAGAKELAVHSDLAGVERVITARFAVEEAG